MRFGKLAFVWLLVAHSPVNATTHDDIMNCAVNKLVERAGAPDCPSITQIRREVFDSCRPQIEGYIETAKKEGKFPIDEAEAKSFYNDFITNLIERSAPRIRKQAFCDEQ
jgi:hypothetical protein